MDPAPGHLSNMTKCCLAVSSASSLTSCGCIPSGHMDLTMDSSPVLPFMQTGQFHDASSRRDSLSSCFAGSAKPQRLVVKHSKWKGVNWEWTVGNVSQPPLPHRWKPLEAEEKLDLLSMGGQKSKHIVLLARCFLPTRQSWDFGFGVFRFSIFMHTFSNYLPLPFDTNTLVNRNDGPRS